MPSMDRHLDRCKRGHLLDYPGRYRDGEGQCRKCQQRNARLWYWRNRNRAIAAARERRKRRAAAGAAEGVKSENKLPSDGMQVVI